MRRPCQILSLTQVLGRNSRHSTCLKELEPSCLSRTIEKIDSPFLSEARIRMTPTTCVYTAVSFLTGAYPTVSFLLPGSGKSLIPRSISSRNVNCCTGTPSQWRRTHPKFSEGTKAFNSTVVPSLSLESTGQLQHWSDAIDMEKERGTRYAEDSDACSKISLSRTAWP